MAASEIAKKRRLAEGYFDKYFVGKGVDMGCGDDPVTPDCLKYDAIYGLDAQNPNLPKESFDFVFSSHCLEHLPEPKAAVIRWWNLVKPGGHLIISVPDWILYEQRQWPSQNNRFHRWTFSMFEVPATESHFVLSDLFKNLRKCQIRSYRLIDDGYNYKEVIYDRTYDDKSAAEIEIICRKMPTDFWV